MPRVQCIPSTILCFWRTHQTYQHRFKITRLHPRVCAFYCSKMSAWFSSILLASSHICRWWMWHFMAHNSYQDGWLGIRTTGFGCWQLTAWLTNVLLCSWWTRVSTPSQGLCFSFLIFFASHISGSCMWPLMTLMFWMLGTCQWDCMGQNAWTWNLERSQSRHSPVYGPCGVK